jgi:uncharacterized membrane protein
MKTLLKALFKVHRGLLSVFDLIYWPIIIFFLVPLEITGLQQISLMFVGLVGWAVITVIYKKSIGETIESN